MVKSDMDYSRKGHSILLPSLTTQDIYKDFITNITSKLNTPIPIPIPILNQISNSNPPIPITDTKNELPIGERNATKSLHSKARLQGTVRIYTASATLIKSTPPAPISITNILVNTIPSTKHKQQV